MNLRKMQKKHWKWAKRNFGKPPAHQALLGALEELGELAHSYIKAEQGIRGSQEELEDQGKDAIADVILFLMQYCSLKGWDMQDLLESTTEEVWMRDWKAYPYTGFPEPVAIDEAKLGGDTAEIRLVSDGSYTDGYFLRSAFARLTKENHKKLVSTDSSPSLKGDTDGAG